MFDNLGQVIVNETNLLFEDKPHFFKGLMNKEIEHIASWKSIEECINNPQFYNFEIVGNDSMKKDIPCSQKSWVTDKLVQDKRYVANCVKDGDTLIITNYGFNNSTVNHLLGTIENIFDINAAAHLYCGKTKGSQSFNIHEDYPANFICQIEGKTIWKVFNNRISYLYKTGTMNNQLTEEMLDTAIDVVLEPGDVLYIPSRAYHVAIPKDEQRISLSIPCWNRFPTDPIDNSVDRNYYTI